MIALLKKSLLTNWILVVGWAAAIFLMSSQPATEEPGFWMPPHADKVVHAVIFGILSCLLFTALYKSGASAGAALILAIVLTSLYGVTDEWHQSMVAGRTTDIYDWVADTIGAMSAFILFQRKS